MAAWERRRGGMICVSSFIAFNLIWFVFLLFSVAAWERRRGGRISTRVGGRGEDGRESGQ